MNGQFSFYHLPGLFSNGYARESEASRRKKSKRSISFRRQPSRGGQAGRKPRGRIAPSAQLALVALIVLRGRVRIPPDDSGHRRPMRYSQTDQPGWRKPVVRSVKRTEGQERIAGI